MRGQLTVSENSLSHVFDVYRFQNGLGSGLDGGQYRAHINGTLEIKRARAEDEGTYTCVASSILGKAENQVRLEVKGQTLHYCTEMRHLLMSLYPNITVYCDIMCQLFHMASHCM